jgi:hypothetical protein
VTALQWAGAIAGLVALVLSILLNLRQLSTLFVRGKCVVASSYHSPSDLVGFASKPRFVLHFENKGSLPMDFRHFDLLLPRLEGVMEAGHYVGYPGAELFQDGKPLGSRLMERQEFRKIDALTRTVRVDAHSSELEFFELDAFLPQPSLEGWPEEPLPSDFKPLLQFRQSPEREFHCDQAGIHPGPYVWPHAEELRIRMTVTPAKVVEIERSRFLRRWTVKQRDADLGNM